MKFKTNKLFGLLGVLLLLGIGFYFLIMSDYNLKPKRLDSIPESTTWIGGVDEGFWFEIIEIDSKERVYRFKIYNDYNGELVLDAKFIKDSACDNEYPLNKSVLNKISHFEFDKIEMIDNCKLILIKPAYGGSFWELDKEIQKQQKPLIEWLFFMRLNF